MLKTSLTKDKQFWKTEAQTRSQLLIYRKREREDKSLAERLVDKTEVNSHTDMLYFIWWAG